MAEDSGDQPLRMNGKKYLTKIIVVTALIIIILFSIVIFVNSDKSSRGIEKEVVANEKPLISQVQDKQTDAEKLAKIASDKQIADEKAKIAQENKIKTNLENKAKLEKNKLIVEQAKAEILKMNSDSLSKYASSNLYLNLSNETKEEIKNFALETYAKILPLEMIKNAQQLPAYKVLKRDSEELKGNYYKFCSCWIGRLYLYISSEL